MPEIFIPFGAFAPEGGDVGEGLVRSDNAIPIHRGHRPLRQRADVATLAGDGPVTGAFVHIFQAEITQQHALPASDGNPVPIQLVGSDGRTEDLWELLHKKDADDSKFVVWGGAPTDIEISFPLEPLEDPGVHTGHAARLRYRVTGGGGAWTVTVGLNSGLSTVAGWSESGTGDTEGWVDVPLPLEESEAENISNYEALRLDLGFTVAGSAQFGRPVQDLALNGWTNQAGSSTNVFQAIDEASASDADYAQSPPLQLGGARSKYRVALTDLVDPFVKDDAVGTYTLRYRYKATNAGVNVKATLGHGGTGTGGTVIVSQEHTGITPGSFIAGSLEIEDEIWAIASSAYENLWIEFEGHWPTEGSSVATQNVVATANVHSSGMTPSGAATLWEAIATDDAATVVSDGSFGSQVTVAAPGVDPGLDTAHLIRLEGFSSTAPAVARGKVTLFEGLVERFTGNFTVTGVGSEVVFPIHPSFAATIGNYANLRLQIEDRPGAGEGALRINYVRLETTAPRRAQISWAELETPSTAQGQISLVNLSVPAVVTEYAGDKPTIYAGTPSALYEVSASGFEDISKSGGYGVGVTGETGAAWRFCQIGNHVIATDGSSPVQWREDSAGDFADLITTPSPDPTARFIAPWRERLLLGSIGLTDHAVDEIWVSSANDIQDFEPSEETRAGFEPIRSRPGQIMGLVGGQEGVILKRNNIFQMLYTGGSTLFRIEEVPSNFVGGLAYPSSLVEQGQWYYGHSGECFFRGSLDEVTRIGDGSVTRMLTDAENLDESLAELNPGSIAIEDQLMVGARDPKTGLILWTYQAKTDEPWRHSRGVLYNPLEDRWSPVTGPFDVSAITSIPNTINADTHLMKSVLGFSWDGTDATWFKFSGDTMEVVFDTKLRRLPSASDAVRDPTTGRFAEPAVEPMLSVRAVRPVFSFPRTADVTLPAATVSVTGYRDADRTSDTMIVETATADNRNDRGIYNFGRGVHGFYHSFAATLAPTPTNAVYNLVGWWVEYDVAGAR